MCQLVESACLACIRPWIGSSELQKQVVWAWHLSAGAVKAENQELKVTFNYIANLRPAWAT